MRDRGAPRQRLGLLTVWRWVHLPKRDNESTHYYLLLIRDKTHTGWERIVEERERGGDMIELYIKVQGRAQLLLDFFFFFSLYIIRL